jgi:hypothetical protein
MQPVSAQECPDRVRAASPMGPAAPGNRPESFTEHAQAFEAMQCSMKGSYEEGAPDPSREISFHTASGSNTRGIA